MINLDSETKSETEINCTFTDIKLKNYSLNCRINEDMKGDFQTGISFIGDNVLITYLDTYNESIIEEKKVNNGIKYNTNKKNKGFAGAIAAIVLVCIVAIVALITILIILRKKNVKPGSLEDSTQKALNYK